MRSVHKLMGRLNASTCRFDIGRGGIPELTSQDIAGALGMIRDEFAREVFCAVWWPDGAKLMWKDLDRIIARMQFGEWRDRADALLNAEIALAYAKSINSSAAEVRARTALIGAKEQQWPGLTEDAYSAIRAAVITEIRAPRVCQTCQGRATVKTDDLLIMCKACEGSGSSAVSDRQRARMLNRNVSTYTRVWRPVYEWTYRKVTDAERAGAVEFAQRLAA
jgi:hypothetical protein